MLTINKLNSGDHGNKNSNIPTLQYVSQTSRSDSTAPRNDNDICAVPATIHESSSYMPDDTTCSDISGKRSMQTQVAGKYPHDTWFCTMNLAKLLKGLKWPRTSVGGRKAKRQSVATDANLGVPESWSSEKPSESPKQTTSHHWAKSAAVAEVHTRVWSEDEVGGVATSDREKGKGVDADVAAGSGDGVRVETQIARSIRSLNSGSD